MSGLSSSLTKAKGLIFGEKFMVQGINSPQGMVTLAAVNEKKQGMTMYRLNAAQHCCSFVMIVCLCDESIC
jgi:hypothetical protein